MSDAAVIKPEGRKTSSVPPFSIEADHHRNSDLILQGIVGVILRSRTLASRTKWDKRARQFTVPEPEVSALGKFPEIPGMQLHVNPAECTYKVIDPLKDDKELCSQIKKAMQQHTGHRIDQEFQGMPEQSGTLDKHRMKTLVREMLRMVKANEARVIKGMCPDEDDVNAMEGKYLLNPGSTVQNFMPRFEEDYEKYAESLNRVGG